VAIVYLIASKVGLARFSAPALCREGFAV